MTHRIIASIRSDEGRSKAIWKGMTLETVFQPVFAVAQRRIVGVEALARGVNHQGTPLLPRDIFPSATTLEQTVFLDRLLRTIHLLNFSRIFPDPLWLFLNVDPKAATSGRKFGRFFQEILEWTGVDPQKLVVEILESAIDEKSLLTEAAAYYRDCGTLIAIDDFGSGHSNFDRIWSIKPELVKIDRSMILHASKSMDVRRLMPEMVSLVRASGSLCLIEGIESPEEGRIALETETDFVQGFHFGRPEVHPDIATGFQFERLLEDIQNADPPQKDSLAFSKILERFYSLVDSTPDKRQKMTLDGLFSDYPCVVRYFILDDKGQQVGVNMDRLSFGGVDHRFRPLMDTSRANWSHRAYFRHAMGHFGHVHISEPYLSTTGVHVCRTISLAVNATGPIRVHCLDLDWPLLSQRISL